MGDSFDDKKREYNLMRESHLIQTGLRKKFREGERLPDFLWEEAMDMRVFATRNPGKGYTGVYFTPERAEKNLVSGEFIDEVKVWELRRSKYWPLACVNLERELIID